MWCKYHGRICRMVIDKETNRIRFIRRKKWLEMSARETERYIW